MKPDQAEIARFKREVIKLRLPILIITGRRLLCTAHTDFLNLSPNQDIPARRGWGGIAIKQAAPPGRRVWIDLVVDRAPGELQSRFKIAAAEDQSLRDPFQEFSTARNATNLTPQTCHKTQALRRLGICYC